LGASVKHIIAILTFDTVKLILACSVIAIPVAYLLVNQWLRTYAFRVPLNVWQFVVPVIVLIVITLATISVLTVNAARANPAATLKDE